MGMPVLWVGDRSICDELESHVDLAALVAACTVVAGAHRGKPQREVQNLLFPNRAALRAKIKL